MSRNPSILGTSRAPPRNGTGLLTTFASGVDSYCRPLFPQERKRFKAVTLCKIGHGVWEGHLQANSTMSS
jgi:hypothetical protein